MWDSGYQLMEPIFSWLLRWSEVVGALGSVLLSSLLVYFYRQMRDVQEAQAEIQENQTELIETQTEISRANHEPLISVSAISFKLGDRITLEIENEGNGIARNLALVSRIETENKYYDIQPTVTPLTESSDSSLSQGSNLAANDSGKFDSSVVIGMKSDYFTDTLSRFTTATAKLNYTGTQSATVHLFVRYENILGDVRKEAIEPVPVWITKPLSIESAFSQSMDPIAEDLPFTASTLIDSRHIGTRHSPGDREGFCIDFQTRDMLVEQALSLDITTPAGVQGEVKRDQGTVGSLEPVTTIKEESDRTIEFDGNDHDRLDHGELVHIFATKNEESWQIDLIGSGDHRPGNQPHVAAIRRRQLIKQDS